MKCPKVIWFSQHSYFVRGKYTTYVNSSLYLSIILSKLKVISISKYYVYVFENVNYAPLYIVLETTPELRDF